MIIDVAAYICLCYPRQNTPDLSTERLCKIIFLCDWTYTIIFKKPLLDACWRAGFFGPMYNDFNNIIEESALFSLREHPEPCLPLEHFVETHATLDDIHLPEQVRIVTHEIIASTVDSTLPALNEMTLMLFKKTYVDT